MDGIGTVIRKRHIGRLGSAVGLGLVLLAAAGCGGTTQSSVPKAAASARPAGTQAGPGGAQAPAARTSPSSEQIANVITEVKQRIALSFTPTEAHVRAFGDAACAAFDQGKTQSQVRNLVLQAASQLPSVSVSSADADFAVRNAVDMFCPGYTSRLAS